MSKPIRVTIETPDREIRTETIAILGAVVAEEVPGGSDTTQFFITDGNLDKKEAIKLLAGVINSMYRSIEDPRQVERIVEIAHEVAKEAFKMHGRHGY